MRNHNLSRSQAFIISVALLLPSLVSVPSAFADALGGPTTSGAGGTGIPATSGAGGTAALPTPSPTPTPVPLTTYSLSYQGNGETGGTVPPTSFGNGIVAVSANVGNLVKAGFIFSGWADQYDGSGAQYPVGGPINLDINRFVVAKWLPAPPHSITYFGNGNTGGSAPVQSVGQGALFFQYNYAALVKSGFSFAGWNTQANGLGTDYAEGTSILPTINLIVYAKWTPLPVYYISYIGNGYNAGAVPGTTVGNGTVFLANVLPVFKKTGFTFAGWNTQANGLGITYATGSAFNLNASKVLYAKWKPKPFSITYFGNGNTSGNPPPKTIDSLLVILPGNSGGMSKGQLYFKGWNTQANGLGLSYPGGSTFNLSASVNLYARWGIQIR